MDHHVELAQAKQAFESLVAMREPKEALTWQPSDEQRNEYVRLAERALAGLDKAERLESRQLLGEGRLQSFIPESMLAFVREQMKPRVSALRAALDHFDPNGKFFREILEELGRPSGASGLVKRTFETGLQQVYELIDRNPDWGDDHKLLPDTAYEVVDLKLIDFEPDAWLDRADELKPIRTNKSNVELPSHVRLRVMELYRAYVFGCWLSVLGLSRAILEYAVLDNLHKFRIEPSWPAGRDGKRRDKKLVDLINELAEHLPQYKVPMERLRDYGNEYLHPKKSQVSKQSLFQRQAAAKDAVSILVEVVEGIYLAPKETS
jgi:hypothetical protein